MRRESEVVVVGGGLVGTSAALALARVGVGVVQLEAEPAAPATAARGEERHFALARRSVEALTGLGAWPAIAPEACALAAVHVSSRGDFGTVRIRAVDYGLDALGHTAPARCVAAALEAAADAERGLTRVRGARVLAVESGADAWARIAFERDGERTTLAARLVVAADGSESALRAAAGIGVRRHDYGQTAIVTSIVPGVDPAGVAYERFTDTGPLALLPLASGRVGVVHTVAAAEAATVLALDDEAYAALLGERFGSRLGALRRPGRRQAWPLARIEAEALTAPRLVLIGNAAQTIHPVAAQGFNLGLRDALALREAVLAARADPGAPEALAAYAAARRADRDATIAWSDTLARSFARRDPLTRLGRTLAFGVLGLAGAWREDLAYALMGYRSAAPPRAAAGGAAS